MGQLPTKHFRSALAFLPLVSYQPATAGSTGRDTDTHDTNTITSQSQGMPESKPVVDLSWQPHLHTPSLSKVTDDGSHTKSQTSASNNTLWKPNTELVDGLFVLPNNPRKLHKLLRKQVEDTSGQNWFNMPAQTITLELQKDLKLLKLRAAIDPKWHYKKGDSKSKDTSQVFPGGNSCRFSIGLLLRQINKEVEESNTCR